MIATRTRERSEDTGEITAIVSCRYCPQLDHWVPITGIEIDAAAIRCADAQVVIGVACPVCGGLIPAHERAVDCRFCAGCLQYVPVRLWGRHRGHGCCD
jgi:hypothetical protein